MSIPSRGESYFYLSQEEIVDRYKVLVAAEAGVAEDTLTFCGGCYEDSGDYGRAWIGSVSAAELERLHAAHRNRLFAGNVRLFIGTRKGSINEQIIKSARDNPGEFWALNNGITILADSAIRGDEESGTTILQLRRFSIVNGCQTTSSLVRAKPDPKTKVLARVIAAKATLRSEVVRFNNSQNAIRIWAVRAVDDLQQQLRVELKKFSINYAPKMEGARIVRSQSMIELDRVTQFLAASSHDFLLQAIDNKAELFDQPYQKIFFRGIKAPEIFLAWSVGLQADEERQALVDKLHQKQEAGLLSVASTHWIVFVTYKLFDKFTGSGVRNIGVDRLQSAEMQNALRKYVKQAADMFVDAAIDTYSRDEFGSNKSALRSAKFLEKIDQKVKLRAVRLADRLLPDLVAVAKSSRTRVS